MQGGGVDGVSLGVVDVAAGLQPAHAARGLHLGGHVPAVVEEVVRVEQQVEVLGRLRQEEALHPVLQRVGEHVLDGGVPAGCPGGVLDGAEDVEARVYEPGVARGAVQVYDALY